MAPRRRPSGATKLGAMVHGKVNVVRAHDLAGEPASQVRLLVGGPRREQHREKAPPLVVGQDVTRWPPSCCSHVASTSSPCCRSMGVFRRLRLLTKLVAELDHVAELPGCSRATPNRRCERMTRPRLSTSRLTWQPTEQWVQVVLTTSPQLCPTCGRAPPTRRRGRRRCKHRRTRTRTQAATRPATCPRARCRSARSSRWRRRRASPRTRGRSGRRRCKGCSRGRRRGRRSLSGRLR